MEISKIHKDNLELAVKAGDYWAARDILSSVYLDGFTDGIRKGEEIFKKVMCEK